MSSTVPTPCELDTASREAALRLLATDVYALARRIDSLWSEHPTDDIMALRLVEASHSLHRVAIALRDDFAIGGRFRSN